MSPFKTLLLMTSLLIIGVSTGIAVFFLGKGGSGPTALDATPVSINALRLTIPHQFFRGGAPPRNSMSERVDLVLRHPAMTAAGIPPSTTTELSAQDPRELIFVSILRGDGVIDPADRPQDLYGRFLEPDTWQNPGGLLLRRFEAGSPYEDEELFLTPPDGKAFAARCRKPGKGSEGIGEACLWRLRRDGADLQVRFSPDLLPQWEIMSAGISARLAEWAAK
jgi:hypothetical protein